MYAHVGLCMFISVYVIINFALYVGAGLWNNR